MSFGKLGSGFGHIGRGGTGSYSAPVADVNKTGSDTLAPKITEGTAARLPMLNRTDTLAPKITESTATLLATSTVTDTISPLGTEGVSDVRGLLARTDTLAPLLTESRSLDIGGTVAKSATDTLLPKIDEAINARQALLVRTDTLAPKITDLTVQKDMTVGDGLKPKITEGTTLISAQLSRTDTLSPKITEASTVDDAAAVPGDISDLTVAAIDATTAQLVYTPATGATSHEYRYSPYGQADWSVEDTTPVDNIIEDIAA